ncbi:MAG: peptide-binding protein [Deltaproteobacteria bacterium]|nr:MAG: peptide-binding protein [Deltaproteobacteria bacterium]
MAEPAAATTEPEPTSEDDEAKPARELPFFIHPSKRLPDFEREEKKEGTFITGLPELGFDPIRGFGVGGTLNLFVNKDRSDPFFDYTPYRHRIKTQLFIFQNGRIRYELNYDAPYIADSRWRLRADAVLWEDPEAQFWGIGRDNIRRLRFRDKRSGQERDFRNVNDYEDNLALALQDGDGVYRTDLHHHHMLQREQLYNLLGERVMLGGRLRFMFGYEALLTSFQSYGGRVTDEAVNLDGEEVDAINNETLVDRQLADGTFDRFNLGGFNNSSQYQFTSMLAFALIYDTRDYEPDPTKGVFVEYSHEYSAPWLGSQFDFNKFMLQGQGITTPITWNNGRGRLTLAGMASLGYIFGPNINFIEMWDLSSQAEAGGIMVMGGERSLRGYREARYMAPLATLVNFEVRTRLYDFNLFKQHFGLGLTPFLDAGSVFDDWSQLSFERWRVNGGLGARIAWNQSTILRLDYAVGREGSQTFFGFGHIF